MGYGRTPKSVERTRPLLDEMLKSDKSIEWIFDDPQTVAYKIWEAIHYAVKSKKVDFVKYTTLLNKYSIRVIQPDILKAEIKKPPTLTPNGMVIREVIDVLEVIAVAIEFRKPRLIFPDILFDLLGTEDKEILETWCENNNYAMKNNSLGIELVRDG